MVHRKDMKLASIQSQKDWKNTAVRLPPDLHSQVHDAARAEDRSFNGQIVALIREGLQSRGRSATATAELVAESEKNRERNDEAAKQGA